MTAGVGSGITPATAEYVVVGAGIIGAAVAAQLAHRGAAPLLLEAECPARGATGASGGMVRGYDPDPVVARLAAASLLLYADPTAWFSGTAPLHAVGSVTLVAADQAPELNRAAQELQAAGGSGQVVVGAEEVCGVRTAGGAALVEPEAGWVDPVLVTELLVRQAVRDGARLVSGACLTALRPAGDGVLLETSAGTVHARLAVVLAIGGWMARPPDGVQLGNVRVRTRSIQASVVRRPVGAPPHATFVDLRTGGYGKPCVGHASVVGTPLLVWDESPGACAGPDARHHRRTLEVVCRNLPWVAGSEVARVVRSFDGYADSSDVMVPTNLHGVWFARAGNGGGVRVAPQLGREITDRLLGESRPVHTAGSRRSVSVLKG